MYVPPQIQDPRPAHRRRFDAYRRARRILDGPGAQLLTTREREALREVVVGMVMSNGKTSGNDLTRPAVTLVRSIVVRGRLEREVGEKLLTLIDAAGPNGAAAPGSRRTVA